MEAEPQSFMHVGAASPHSRTLTPTAAVRPRPRPPLALSGRSQSIEHPIGGDGTAATDGGGVDDIAGALSELGRTDFVRKYSRKSRQPRSSVGDTTTTSPTSDIDIRSAASSPVVSAASRYHHLRSPASAGSDASATKYHNEDHVGGGGDSTATCTDNYRNIPSAQDGDVRTTDHSATSGISDSGRDGVEERSKRASGSRTATASPRAGTGLFRSESDASKLRPFTLRSLRPKTMATVKQSPTQSQKVRHVPPPAPRGGVTTPLVGDRVTPATNSAGPTELAGAELDDEGVGAVDIDEPCFKDTYMSVTTAGSGGAGSNRGALLPSLYLPADAVGPTRARHQRLAEHGSPLAETSGTPGGVSGSTQKTNSGGRFLTHPPLRERIVTHEPGSVDSNGLGALRDVSDPTKQMLCLASQVSVSSADSHICPSEDSASLSLFGADGNAESGLMEPVTEDVSSPDQLARKNSKTQRQKSRSDPTRGEKNGDSSVVDIPSIVSGTLHAQSSPVLLDDDDKTRQQSTTQFPFTTDSASASASDLSDRGGVGTGANDGQSDDHVVAAGAGDSSAKSSPSASIQDVAVRVVLKSDDSFEELPPANIKPPRPKATKKRPRAPASQLTTPIIVGAAETSLSASSLVRKVFSKDRGSSIGGRLQTKDAGSESELATAASTSSLTIPFSKKSSLLRSHSSAGNEAGSGGSATSDRSKHPELPQSLAIARQRSPGAPEAAVDHVPRNGGVTASASVPELCDASSGSVVGRKLHVKDHNNLTTSYTPSLEPVLSSSTISLFDGPAGDKVGFRCIFRCT